MLLFNTSEIPMTFNLRIGGEDRGQQKVGPSEDGLTTVAGSHSDFVVLPQSGTLPPNFQIPIEVSLSPGK